MIASGRLRVTGQSLFVSNVLLPRARRPLDTIPQSCYGVGMETNQAVDLNEHPWLRHDAERLEALVGFTVIAAPNGPMGPQLLGTLTRWSVHDEDRLVATVDTTDGPEVECFHYDVVAAAGIPLRRAALLAQEDDR